jgi:NADH/F420H2 dehydrogenase subunit C
MSFYPDGNPEARITTKVLRRELGEDVLEVTDHRGDLAVRLALPRISEALQLLKQDPELQYDLMLDLCGVDWRDREPRFEVVYHLKSLSHGHRVRIKVGVPEKEPVLPTATDTWKAAEWFEREAFDLYGIRFEGHPDLRRILCHDQFEGHPLRKDYPQARRHKCTEVSNLE